MDARSPQPPERQASEASTIPLSIGDRRRRGWAGGGRTRSAPLPRAVLWPETEGAATFGVLNRRAEERGFDLGRLLARLLGFGRLPARFAALGLLAYAFAFNFSVVRGSSMAPGIHDGDRILIDQLSYLFTDVERGDIVVLQYPLDPRLDYIKRVVGLPGDEVVMEGGALWINGDRQEEDYLLEQDPYTRLQVVVKAGHYFVLGDNRLHSSDSREFGQVREELVRGKVDLRLWPPARAGRIH